MKADYETNPTSSLFSLLGRQEIGLELVKTHLQQVWARGHRAVLTGREGDLDRARLLECGGDAAKALTSLFSHSDVRSQERE